MVGVHFCDQVEGINPIACCCSARADDFAHTNGKSNTDFELFTHVLAVEDINSTREAETKMRNTTAFVRFCPHF